MPPFPTCSIIQSVMSGVSGCPILNRSNPVSLSSSAACIKYRESVQTPAFSLVTTAVPADPVKPLIHFLDSQCLGGYSLRWASVLGMINASRLFSPMNLRMASSLSGISFAFIFFDLTLKTTNILNCSYI